MTLQATLENNEKRAEAVALVQTHADALLKNLPKREPGFQPGRSGNPGGRPRGAFSRRTNPLRGLLNTEARPVLKAVIAAAKGGDMGAARIVIDRILPRERLIKIALPKVRSAADALAALGIILDSVASGEVSANEAASLATLARAYVEISNATELMARLEALEAKAAGQ